MNADKFRELISLITITNIQFIDSHETVLKDEPHENGIDVQIKTEQGINNEDPLINENHLVFRPKYTFEFITDEEPYFRAEYILAVAFDMKDSARCIELFEDQEIKQFFLSKQLHRILWSVLRGTLLDAFNRHSLKPLPLPLLQ